MSESDTTARVGVVYDPIFLEHRSVAGHPERPERLEAVVAALQENGMWERLTPVEARPARADEVTLVHSPDYLARLEAEARGKAGYLDPDTYFAPASLDAALRACGGTIDLVSAVLDSELDAGLALVRPPGHHAEQARSGGFCILNHVAVAAALACNRGMRPAIIDFDVHHGNGTQFIFYRDPRVLYVSVHRRDGFFYPGTGGNHETGAGEGIGTTLNIPLSAGAGGQEYRHCFSQQIEPALEAFQPDVLLVSAGFDAHLRDPLGGMRLDDQGHQWIAGQLCQWAASLCQGRWTAVLEGGYDLQALSRGIVALTGHLLQQPE